MSHVFHLLLLLLLMVTVLLYLPRDNLTYSNIMENCQLRLL